MRQSERVYERLRADIVEWRLAPGTALNEIELSQQLAVSRTPVREAIQRLAREGLITTVHGRSAHVAAISLDDVVKQFQMREALETYAARLCARRPDRASFEELRLELERSRPSVRDHDASDDYADYYDLIRRFDEAIDTGADNPYLLSSLRELRGHLHRLRRLARRRPERMATTVDEHLAICQAICDGDEMLAAQATAVHIHNSLRNILTALMEDVAGPTVFGSAPSMFSPIIGQTTRSTAATPATDGASGASSVDGESA